MSSEKLSPRQQMINMMYIMLTAMLALNVSSVVLDKYGVINANLETTTEKNFKFCDAKIEQMKKAVSDSGNKEKDVEKLTIAIDSLHKTEEICNSLTQMKTDMVMRSGGWDKKNPKKPKDGKNDHVVVKYMIKEENSERLKNLVNSHIDYLNKLSNFHFEHIAVDGEHDPYFCDDPNQAGKPYGLLNFDNHVPLVAAMSTISGYQSTLIASCSDVIDVLYNSVGADQLKFDIVRPLLASDSNMVVAGMNYKASLFLGASSSAIIPKMFIDGKELKVSKDGIGDISLPTSANVKFDKDGISVQKIKATIKQLNPSTGEEIVTEKFFEYKIVKPSLDVQSGAVSALYRNCGNEMIIKCPALGANYFPVFKVSGGEVVRNPNNKEMITIIPSSELKNLKDSRVFIQVYSGSNLLGNVDYPIRKVPLPQISVLSNSQLVDERKGINPDIVKNFGIKITPDESFASFLPRDANYQVTKWAISAIKGTEALFTKNVENQNFYTFPGNEKMILYQADRILIEVKNIVRINCKGDAENVFDPGVVVIKNIPISTGI
ncbi:MAG: gliding motility protein GldM [Cytophagales bacterium]|jgi:gliding motility-associated protein GldM|nr:gliding motility protein GldM [Cytophagales bacterium]